MSEKIIESGLTTIVQCGPQGMPREELSVERVHRFLNVAHYLSSFAFHKSVNVIIIADWYSQDVNAKTVVALFINDRSERDSFTPNAVTQVTVVKLVFRRIACNLVPLNV
jgi:hypothetical protein